MKRAIITGASRGIGREVALTLANNGYEVALLSRSKDKLETVSKEIAGNGGKSIVLPCDVSNEKQVQDTIRHLKEEWNTLDLLFNNAGVYEPGTTEISIEDLRKLYEINVLGAISLLQATVPWFKEQGAGTIVNLASIAGTIGFPGVGAYCSTKFALRGFSESLHRELEPLGIRVATISPSWVNTDMAAHGPMSDDKKIDPADIANTILYLENLGPNATVMEIVVGCRADLQ